MDLRKLEISTCTCIFLSKSHLSHCLMIGSKNLTFLCNQHLLNCQTNILVSCIPLHTYFSFPHCRHFPSRKAPGSHLISCHFQINTQNKSRLSLSTLHILCHSLVNPHSLLHSDCSNDKRYSQALSSQVTQMIQPA